MHNAYHNTSPLQNSPYVYDTRTHEYKITVILQMLIEKNLIAQQKLK